MNRLALYTIVPLEEVLSEEETVTGRPFEMTMGGKRLLVAPEGPGQGRIMQLLSTDPADFLDPRWHPGNMIIWLKTD
jgi:hypothetical protein